MAWAVLMIPPSASRLSRLLTSPFLHLVFVACVIPPYDCVRSTTADVDSCLLAYSPRECVWTRWATIRAAVTASPLAAEGPLLVRGSNNAAIVIHDGAI